MTSAEEERDRDRAAVAVLVLAVVLLIAVQILATGFLPVDDALRHAGKAVSGRSWQQILVARAGIVDLSPGWHGFLHLIHRFTGANAHTLVWIGIACLFVLFSAGPAALMRKPEAWLCALIVGAALEPQLVMRLVIGRPLVFAMTILVVMCLTWRRLDTEPISRGAFVAAASMIAAATWIHGSWYLWALPVIACFGAGQRRVGIRLAVATVVGVVIGALVTGHPIAFLRQHLELALNLRGGGITGWVYEMQPYPYVPMLIVAAPLLVMARKLWLDVPASTVLRDPIFVLAALGWVLGFKAGRFWMDWGTPALLVFIALEIEALWLGRGHSRQRLLVAAGVGLACVLIWTANVGNRWRLLHEPAFRVLLAPNRASALPDSGGVLYTDDRRVFYELFYLNPAAPWRYVLGPAPELMLEDDYAVYVSRMSTASIESLEPWARKLRPEDRLLIRDPRGIPLWSWLEWQQVEGGFYSGRVKRSAAVP